MRMHARETIVTKAELDLRVAISDWSKTNHELTPAEYLKVLLGVTNDQTQSLLKMTIRMERHGDVDKPGGVE
jgi:hypothetical protein